jgi:hypothetical protein
MNLRTALEVYEREGPNDTTNREQTARFMATKVLHLHLTDDERLSLVRAWKDATVTREPFLKKLNEVKTRLASLGYL